VQGLERRGWVGENSAKIQITSKGKQVREQVEAETFRLSFVPWMCLNVSEVEKLSRLVSQ
jgi:hypothetical protein